MTPGQIRLLHTSPVECTAATGVPIHHLRLFFFQYASFQRRRPSPSANLRSQYERGSDPCPQISSTSSHATPAFTTRSIRRLSITSACKRKLIQEHDHFPHLSPIHQSMPHPAPSSPTWASIPIRPRSVRATQSTPSHFRLRLHTSQPERSRRAVAQAMDHLTSPHVRSRQLRKHMQRQPITARSKPTWAI